MDVSSKKIHVVDIIANYFKNLDSPQGINNSKLNDWWYTITNDLLSLIQVEDKKILNVKLKYQDDAFKANVSDFLTHYNTNYIDNMVNKQVYLNPYYKNVVVTGNICEFNSYYLKIINACWINGFIKYHNENLGIILHNMVENSEYLVSILKPLERYSNLQFYKNYTYAIINRNSQKLIKESELIYLDNKNLDIIRIFGAYMLSILREYIGERYAIYNDTDMIIYAAVDTANLDHNNISKFIFNNIGSTFTHSFTPNNNYIFIGLKKYLCITNNGKLELIGIKRVDPNDLSTLNKHIRATKLSKLFE